MSTMNGQAAPAKAVKTAKAARAGRRVTKETKETSGAPALEVQPVEPTQTESKPAGAKPQKRRTMKAAGAAQAASASVLPSPAEKPKRTKKEKVVRDSFTMPKSDYERIAKLKQKCLDAGVAVKKSELLRAGLQALDAIPVKRLLAAVASVETVKTGRPAKS